MGLTEVMSFLVKLRFFGECWGLFIYQFWSTSPCIYPIGIVNAHQYRLNEEVIMAKFT
jgi:hypothetical protein